MCKVYKVRDKNGGIYKTSRKSYIALLYLCKLVLLRRKVKRFIRRTLKENKILILLFISLLLLYSTFYLFETTVFTTNGNISLKKYIIYIWNQKDIFITSIGIVLFINIGTNEKNRKYLLEKRFDLCSNIQRNFKEFLIALNYEECININDKTEKEILENISKIDNKEIDNIIKCHKDNILSLLEKTHIVKEIDGDNGEVREEEFISQINGININTKDSKEKIKLILNDYKGLYNYFYSIWKQDKVIDKIMDYIIEIIKYN